MDMRYLLKRSVDKYADREMLVDKEKRLSFSETNILANKLANALLGLGVGWGERVAVLIPNIVEFVVCDIAIIKGCMVNVPINRRLTAKECAYIIENSGARVLIYHRSLINLAEEIRSTVQGVQFYIGVGGCSDGDMPFETLCQNSSGSEPAGRIDEYNDLCRLSYTAGTTGKPKGAMITHRNLRAAVTNLLLERFHPSPEDVFMAVAPLTHGTGVMIYAFLLMGAKVVIFDQFDPEDVLKTIERERVTYVGNLVPTMIGMLLEHPLAKKVNLSTIKQLNYGAAPISEPLLRQALEIFGPVFAQGYGLSEAPLSSTLLTRSDHILSGAPEDVLRLKSIGRELMNVEIRIVDENNQEVLPDVPGELIVRGEHVMKGYWNNPEATKAKIKDGWLHTEDVGRRDDRGYIYLIDRKGDMLISGGFNVYPKEVEDVLIHHEAVKECAVIGVPHPKWGETVKAIVVLKAGQSASEQELIEFCKQRIAGYKRPQSIEFYPALPYTAYGKVNKKELKAKYWSDN